MHHLEKSLNFVGLWVCDFHCITMRITTKCKRKKKEAVQFDQWDHLIVFLEDLEGPLLKSLRFFSDFFVGLRMDNVVFGAGQHHFTATKPWPNSHPQIPAPIIVCCIACPWCHQYFGWRDGPWFKQFKCLIQIWGCSKFVAVDPFLPCCQIFASRILVFRCSILCCCRKGLCNMQQEEWNRIIALRRVERDVKCQEMSTSFMWQVPQTGAAVAPLQWHLAFGRRDEVEESRQDPGKCEFPRFFFWGGMYAMLYAMEHQKTIVESYFENKVTIVHGKVPKFQVKFPVFMVTPFFWPCRWHSWRPHDPWWPPRGVAAFLGDFGGLPCGWLMTPAGAADCRIWACKWATFFFNMKGLLHGLNWMLLSVFFLHGWRKDCVELA